MVPTREIFWNIRFGEIIYIPAIIATGILIHAIYQHYRVWRVGHPANRFKHLKKRIQNFTSIALLDGIIHRKIFGVASGSGHGFTSAKDLLPREFYPGLVHFLIFTGSIVFLLGAFLDFISYYFFHFMEGNFYLGYSAAVDSLGILAIIGVILAIVRRYIQKPERLDNRRDDLVSLLLILALILAGFIVEGLRIAVTELKLAPEWAPWSPGGYILALAFSELSQGTLLIWHRIMWWFHAFLALGAIAYVSLSYSKLSHIILAPINVFFRNLEPRGALVPIELETAETFGAAKIENFNWKQLLDLDACTRCGRCQDACPAYFSGKALNPKKVIQDLKTHLHEVYPVTPWGKPVESRPDMLTDIITAEVIWDCTTCFACQEVCPVYVEHIDKIIDMRRSLALERSHFPESAREVLNCLRAREHPWRGTTATRTDWSSGLGVKALSENSNIDILYWVGCTAALEGRNMKVSAATARILQAAGTNFGILGTEEICCGDPARRMGDEYLFQTLCRKNIELLKSYNVEKILTTCPHCFNTLKNEYPQFGGNFEVIHHTQFIADLIRDGKLKLGALNGNKVVAYHDSCYLGRYNDIYRAPRNILKAISGIKKVELACSGSRSFCCGGGGGHMWIDEEADKRINIRRTEQIIETKADIVATACPYCLSMFEDGLKTKGVGESVKAMDLSELVVQALT